MDLQILIYRVLILLVIKTHLETPFTATALETARDIGGVSFDGTASINLHGVNQAGNQNTSGTAAGLSGSPNITITDVSGVGGNFTGVVTASSGFSGNLTGTVQTAAQPNVTSLGINWINSFRCYIQP